jgi:hypothetical protein
MGGIRGTWVNEEDAHKALGYTCGGGHVSEDVHKALGYACGVIRFRMHLSGGSIGDTARGRPWPVYTSIKARRF